SDGSPLCSATTGGTSSRIYSLKQALREAMAEVGTDEANFGLMRYPEIEVQTQAPACPQGHYSNNDTTGVINPGNTNPGNCTAGASCGNSCECGCRMTAQNSNQTTYGGWFDTS